jgi:dinuclear metal center YbgI/SA1388 family protein
MQTIQQIINFLETIAPLQWQEDYDNAGLACGNPDSTCTGALISLDLTLDVIEEAKKNKFNLIIVHHPPIFKGLKRLIPKDPIAQLIISCIQSDIAVYAIHTNLDNSIHGVNGEIAHRLGLKNLEVLSPMQQSHAKLTTFVPLDHAAKVRIALFEAGAGAIGKYDQCSFNTEGEGSFRPLEGSQPFVGNPNQLHFEKEVKIEVIYPRVLESTLLKALIKSHPYETPAFDLIPLENKFKELGSGAMGVLENSIPERDFLNLVKSAFGTGVIRHSPLLGKKIQKIALCGGAGKFLINSALAKKCDVFLTADLGYHDFFIPIGKMLLADMGHFESEQYTSDLILRLIKEKFPTFALLKTGINTNPVNYFF